MNFDTRWVSVEACIIFTLICFSIHCECCKGVRFYTLWCILWRQTEKLMDSNFNSLNKYSTSTLCSAGIPLSPEYTAVNMRSRLRIFQFHICFLTSEGNGLVRSRWYRIPCNWKNSCTYDSMRWCAMSGNTWKSLNARLSSEATVWYTVENPQKSLTDTIEVML